MARLTHVLPLPLVGVVGVVRGKSINSLSPTLPTLKSLINNRFAVIKRAIQVREKRTPYLKILALYHLEKS